MQLQKCMVRHLGVYLYGFERDMTERKGYIEKHDILYSLYFTLTRGVDSTQGGVRVGGPST